MAFSYLFHICISVIPRHMLICAMLFVLVIEGPLFVYAVIKSTLHTYIFPLFVSMRVLQTIHHITVYPHT